MREMLPVSVAILGVGLIGSSLAADFKRAGVPHVVGYSSNADAHVAREAGWLDDVGKSAADAVSGAQLVILAVPCMAMPELFVQIKDVLAPQALLTDCGSTKRSVIQAAGATLGGAFARYVPGHPVAGSERSGPHAGRPGLFCRKPWILCSLTAQDLEALGIPCVPVFDKPLRGFATRTVSSWLSTATGARVSLMDPLGHDRLFAEISHWPHAVAFALSCSVCKAGLETGAVAFSGDGLRDTTRLGASSPQLWADILLDNRETCLVSGRRFLGVVGAILQAMESGDRASLIVLFQKAQAWRKSLKLFEVM